MLVKKESTVLPIMAYTGRLRPKGYLFQASGAEYEIVGISLVEVSIYLSNQSVKGRKRLTDASWAC